MNETVLFVSLLLATSVMLVLVFLRLRRLGRSHDDLQRVHAELVRRFQPVIDLDREKQRVLGELDNQRSQLTAQVAQARADQAQERQQMAMELATERTRQTLEIERARLQQQQAAFALREQGTQARAELQNLQGNIYTLRAEFSALDEESNLQSFGFYRPRYNFADSERYQARLDDIREEIKATLKDKSAAVCSIEWSRRVH